MSPVESTRFENSSPSRKIDSATGGFAVANKRPDSEVAELDDRTAKVRARHDRGRFRSGAHCAKSQKISCEEDAQSPASSEPAKFVRGNIETGDRLCD